MKILLTFLLAFSLSNASIKIYKNKAQLTYTPTSKFIGFNHNVKASNKDGDIKIISSSCTGKTNSTCKDINKITKLTNTNKALLRKQEVMENLLNNFYSEYKSAKENLDYISQMSDEITKVEAKITKNNDEIHKIKQNNYFRTFTPLYLSKLYKDEIKLNFNGISFYSKYVLNIDKSKLNHSLNIKNSSGIDIKTTTAYIFDKNHYATTPNRAFTPSTASKAQAKIYKKRNMAKSIRPMKSMMAMESDLERVAIVSRDNTKSYTIKNLSLNTDGIERKFVVSSKTVKVATKTIWRTWQNAVFVQGEFPINDTLESNKIDILYNNELIKNSFIRVDGSKQVFNITQDYDLKVKRKKIPSYTNSKGIFNSDTMTKKTIRLDVTNMSDTAKKFFIYEKLPISTDEDIEIKLHSFIEIKGDNRLKTDIKQNKQNGKLSLHVELKPKESKVFIYQYTIKHPKEIKVYIIN